MDYRDIATKSLIYKIDSGAHLYGTATESSDHDYFGIFVPPKACILGLDRCEQVDLGEKVSTSKDNTADDVDFKAYSLPAFVRLAKDCNPNILETLFASSNNTLFIDAFGHLLKEARDLFLSSRVEARFFGYARSQEARLNRPTRDSGEKRKMIIETSGYDTKAASHLIRLLDEATQLMSNGKIIFPLTYAATMRDVKIGKYTYDQFMNDILPHFRIQAEQAALKSILPKKPNLQALNDLQISLLEDYWKTNVIGIYYINQDEEESQ